jgi:hypothetical protein
MSAVMQPDEFVLHCLEQSQGLLGSLPPGAYAREIDTIGGSIGGHMRHCLEHLENLLKGLDSGEVYFENRHRSPELSTIPELALKEIVSLDERLRRASASGRLTEALSARSSLSGDLSKSLVYESSAGRERVYVGLHFVHHMALMAIAARLQGLEVDRDFGKAPATLHYERALSL